MACNDILLAILAVIVFAGILFYLGKCDDGSILNDGTVDPNYDPWVSSTRSDFQLSPHSESPGIGSILAPYTPTYQPTQSKACDFNHKGKRFSRRNRDEIQYNVEDLLPKHFESDWYDVEPLQCSKHIKDSHLIHPSKHMGIDSKGSSLKNATLDPRGDVYIPKNEVGPFLNSTIDPDRNIRKSLYC